MCSGRWALALLAASVGTLSAQDVPRLQARADSLLREWRRASAVADMVDSLNHARAAGGTDTISVGALRIVTNPSPARLREAAARAWPVIDSLYGSEARQLEQHPYLIAPYDPDTTSPKPMRRGAIQVPWDKDVASLAMQDRKSTRLNSSHSQISYAVFCLKKKKQQITKTLYTASACN